jgi:transcription initiation factor TFIID subunit 7
MVKLKIGKGKKDDEPPAERPGLERKPSVKLNFKPKTSATENLPTLESVIEVKSKKQSAKKAKAQDGADAGPGSGVQILKLGKRARKDSDAPDGELPAKRQVKPTERAGSVTFRVPNKPSKAPTLKLNTKIQPQPSGVKLKFSSASAVPQSATTPLIKIRARGKIPKRDPGVGYDSEDEEAEMDPMIENHFVLRMQPGEDCDYLRAAVAESAMKHKPDGSRALGPDVWMKFFDKDGRHGVVSVRGHMYAASLLDLPCIVEAMKSWDKKGWYKTTDICQILLVLGRIDKEEQAKNYTLPVEVDKENWQYPHGLTPPMQWVRKRRFRRRVNRRHIERVEADVEELIARDREWEKEGGADTSISLEYVDPDAPADEDMDAEGEDEDYGFEYEDQDGNVYVGEPEVMDEEDDDDLAAALEAGLAGDDEDQEGEPSATLVAADSSMLHASPDSLVPPETAITPGSGATMSATEDSADDEEYDEDDEAASNEEDEEEKAQRQERLQALAEVGETRKEIAEYEDRLKKSTNALLKRKIQSSLDKLKADLQVKMSGLGMEEEE